MKSVTAEVRTEHRLPRGYRAGTALAGAMLQGGLSMGVMGWVSYEAVRIDAAHSSGSTAFGTGMALLVEVFAATAIAESLWVAVIARALRRVRPRGGWVVLIGGAVFQSLWVIALTIGARFAPATSTAITVGMLGVLSAGFVIADVAWPEHSPLRDETPP